MKFLKELSSIFLGSSHIPRSDGD